MTLAFLILLASMAALNAWATFVLANSTRYDNQQKLLQVLLIWLLPVVGAVLVWSLARDVQFARVTTDLRDRGGNSDGHIRLDGGPSGGEGGGDMSPE